MLWLCIHLPHLPLEALAPSDAQAVAVFAQQKSRRAIVASNAAAGIASGSDLATALAIHPQLRVIERNPAAELTALRRLAAWGYQWSSRITWQSAPAELHGALRYSSALWLEIGASCKLFGGYLALLRRIEDSLRPLQYSYALGIAPSLEGAAVLARAGKRVLVTTPERLLALLAPISIDLLSLSENVLYALKRSGVDTIASLFNVPSTALARRFGPETVHYLDTVRGTVPDLRPHYEPPKQYRERYEFGAALHSTEALLFPLRRMLHELCGYLRALDVAVQEYALIFEHERDATTRIAIGLAGPSRDPERLFALTRERLHALALPANAYGLRIEALEFVAPAVRQQQLFAGAAELTDELEQTLEKINARLGNGSVRTLQTVADHRPEHAWQSGMERASCLPAAARPLWLLPEPQRLPTQPPIDAQAERIVSGWWSNAANRDYHVARFNNGTRGWVFFNHDDSRWYLQGYWG
jgi:protein ImuB